VALSAWAANLPGIAGFSWVLFRRRRTDEALAVTIAMVGTSTTAAITAATVDRKAAIATLPLVAWALFALVLQEEVWRRNQ
jgi:benzodiazapine receptor